MNVVAILEGILRRWYVVVIGLLIAVGAALAVWMAVPAAHERSASLLLMPGDGTLPEGSSNPYLFLGGLSTAADILTRAASSDEALNDIVKEFPDTKVTIVRDYTTSAPAIWITASSETDAEAKQVVDLTIDSVGATLKELQTKQKVPVTQQIRIQELFVDQEGTVQQRVRFTATGMVGLCIALLSLLAASLTDGMIRRSKSVDRRGPVRKEAGRRDRASNRTVTTTSRTPFAASRASRNSKAGSSTRSVPVDDRGSARAEADGVH